MDIKKTITALTFLLLFSGVARAAEPAYTLTRIDLPFRGVADFFADRLQTVSGDLFLSTEGLLDTLRNDERFQELTERLKENRRFQKWRDRFRDLRESLFPEGGQVRLTLRRLKPETYGDEQGLHIVFAVDVDALKALWGRAGESDDRRPERTVSEDRGGRGNFVLHVVLRAEPGEDWAATLTPSAYVEWKGRGKTFEIPEGAFLDKLREYARSAEGLLNGQLDLGLLKRYLLLPEGGIASDDAAPDSLTRRTLDPWVRTLWRAMLAGYPEVYRAEYDTRDAHGRTIRVSAAIVFPFSPPALGRVPVLSIQHPTLVERRFSPSEFQSGLKDSASSQFFAYLALMAAANGYLVVAADYPGLGVSTDPHPFCHASLGESVVDAIRVARSVLDERLAPEGRRWEGKTYLVGYSEGGYASMVAARKLQENGPKELTPAGVACLSGPYSLSEAMRLAMTTPVRDYKTPYLLPMLLAAYDSIYPGAGFAFGTAVRDVPGFAGYPADLRAMIDGVHTEAEINGMIAEAPGYAEMGPMALMTPDFLERLRDPDSEIVRLLAGNDAYRGWVPRMPMKLFHNTKDATVPVTNTTTASVAFEAAGAKTVETELFEVAVPATGNTHVDAAPPSFLKGMLWLQSLREEKQPAAVR